MLIIGSIRSNISNSAHTFDNLSDGISLNISVDISVNTAFDISDDSEMIGYRTSIVRSSHSMLALLAFVLGGVISCGGEGNNRDVVHVEDLRYRLLPGGARILTGILVNEGEETLTVAQIEVSLFDSDNRRISSMFVVVHDVAAGGRRDFREAVDSDLDVQGARVRNIIFP